jgi:hypothetical protein
LVEIFAVIPSFLDAIRRGDSEAVRNIARVTGARTVREVLRAGEAPQLNLPVLQTISAAVTYESPRPRQEEDVALVEPTANGPQHLLADIRAASRAGFKRVYLGHARHARTMDHFNAFLERDNVRNEWSAMMTGAYATGVERVGMIMSFPACATLQWALNRPLEQLRSRLDMHFRRIDADSSMMCPENVSGYTLTNDTRGFVEGVAPMQRTMAMRVDRIVVSYNAGDIRW